MRPRSASLWLVLGFLLTAGPAQATPLAPTAAPLPGSTMQAGDGDQDGAPPLTDWAVEQAGGRVVHVGDPNARDNAFTGGSKENAPGEWGITTEPDGVDPAKANIRDAWGTLEQRSGRTFLSLAFARETAQGTTFLTFELNRDARLWDNGRARIPCRTTGDLLISYEPQGNRVEVVVQRWVTSRADPGTGCAAAGKLQDASDLVPNVDVQGALNAAGIANALPGAYGSTIPAGRFGEAGLDLAAALAEALGDPCFAYTSIWMHSRSSTSESSNLQDYVAPERFEARTCAASGTKFFDRDADGVRDAGEPGLARFVIFADYDGDGVRDPAEPFAVTDEDGDYVVDDIRPPAGRYTLREALPTRRRTENWRCSLPGPIAPGPLGCGWGPIDVAQEPHARGRDFGNWYPARLTVRKRLYPATDEGRFDLLVDGAVIVPAAGNGASRTITRPPGTYAVSESAVPPTDPGGYRSSVECKLGTRRAIRRAGLSSSIALLAGDAAVCTFRNVRPTAPAIAIDKVGPASAEAGTTLRYTLYVENVGAVPFPAGAVDVTDADCDAAPALQDKQGPGGTADPSPSTLDPGDVWTYRCSRGTADPGEACATRRVTNTGDVTGTANGTSVTDSSTIGTVLTCPALPTPGGEVSPPGPEVPAGGVAGTASLLRQPSCVRRGSRVIIRGERIASVGLFFAGEAIRGVSVRPLQDRAVIRVRRNFAPGRYRVTVRVRFQRGAGTAPVRLTRTVRVCGPRPAACTARRTISGRARGVTSLLCLAARSWGAVPRAPQAGG